MGSGYDRENYEELYAIRSRMESIEGYVKEVLSELMKIRRLMEEKAGKEGHGGEDLTAGSRRKVESPYRMPEERKKFGLF